MAEKKSKNEIREDIKQEMENCCINIFENLQANEVVLEGSEVLGFADDFFKILDRQNNKVIVTGDGKKFG